MARRRVEKIDATVTGEIDLTQEIADTPHVFIGVRFLDVDDLVVTPSGGTYSIKVLTYGIDDFQSIPDGDNIDATADPVALSFATNATTLQYTPVSVTGAVSVQISVTGNRS